MNATDHDLVRIEIRALPVGLWAKTQQQTDELLREFALLAAGLQQHPDAHVPTRLLRVVDELTSAYNGFSAEQEAALYAAADNDVEAIDLTYELPAAVGPAARHLEDILTEADEYCGQGQHLLTLASPPDVVAFRRWFLDEFTRQASGRPPTPWSAGKPSDGS